MPKDKINILYIHNMTQISGGERSLLNLWANLDKDRFKSFLIIPQEGGFSEAARQQGVDVNFISVPKLHPANIFKIINAAIHLYKFLRLNKINVVHSYAPRNNILSACVAKCSGIPVIWHERNLIYRDERDITKQFLFLPKFVICNSKAVAGRFQTKDPTKVKIVLNGVNLDIFKPSNDNNTLKKTLGLEGMKIAGMVTNLNQRKHVRFLIEIIPLVLKNVPDVKFLIVGGEFPNEGGVQLKELQMLAESLGVQSHVVFTGFQNDVRPYLNILDVFVHVTEKEACSRAIIEAMAFAKPVVAIDDGGNPELVKDGITGFLTPPGDRHQFAAHVSELLCDDAKRKFMGEKARMRAEQLFDVKRNAKETEQIYLECHA